MSIQYNLEQYDEEREERWRFISGAPPMIGESAAAITKLLLAMAGTIDSEYAAGIKGYRCRARFTQAAWTPPVEEEQLTLDLGDDD